MDITSSKSNSDGSGNSNSDNNSNGDGRRGGTGGSSLRKGEGKGEGKAASMGEQGLSTSFSTSVSISKMERGNGHLDQSQPQSQSRGGAWERWDRWSSAERHACAGVVVRENYKKRRRERQTGLGLGFGACGGYKPSPYSRVSRPGKGRVGTGVKFGKGYESRSMIGGVVWCGVVTYDCPKTGALASGLGLGICRTRLARQTRLVVPLQRTSRVFWTTTPAALRTPATCYPPAAIAHLLHFPPAAWAFHFHLRLLFSSFSEPAPRAQAVIYSARVKSTLRSPLLSVAILLDVFIAFRLLNSAWCI